MDVADMGDGCGGNGIMGCWEIGTDVLVEAQGLHSLRTPGTSRERLMVAGFPNAAFIIADAAGSARSGKDL